MKQTPWKDETLAANGRPVRDNFAAWFGQSKVVNEQGVPLVLYHGTLAHFDAFHLGHGEGQSQGFFFVCGNDINGYLWSYLDGVKYKDDLHEHRGGAYFMPVFLSLQNPRSLLTSTEDGSWADPDWENQQIQVAKMQGHDGLVIRDLDQQTTFYVAFAAHQIKSALGNSGLYLINTPSLSDREAARRLEQSRRARCSIVQGSRVLEAQP